MRRRSGYIGWLFIIPAAVLVVLAWQYRGYLLANRTLPDELTVAGVSMAGKTREQALNELEVAFATPLEVRYVNQSLSLFPDTVELSYDAEVTAANLDAALAKRGGLDGFMAYLLRRPLEQADVLAVVSFSPERLDSFLARVAEEHDQPSQEPVPVPGSLTFESGQPGYWLDLEASRWLVSTALTLATREPVELVVNAETAASPEGTALGQVVQGLLDAHSGLVGGVFVKDLTSGAELAINADVAYSGLSVLKIALLEETYRVLDPPLTAEVTGWLSSAIGVNDGTLEANLLLAQVLGGGDGYRGAETMSSSMQALGLVNTFLMTPFGEEDASVTISTPANSRVERLVVPDSRMQTTPLDMGLLLEMIYQCGEGGGMLMLANPARFDSDQCGQMLEWLSSSHTDSFIEVGVPADVRVAHKQGLTGDTHADAGLVFSRGADFVLVVFLYRPEWLPYEESAPLIADIATATYNYFNVVE